MSNISANSIFNIITKFLILVLLEVNYFLVLSFIQFYSATNTALVSRGWYSFDNFINLFLEHRFSAKEIGAT